MNARASLIFVGFKEGISKVSNKPYKILELSDGIATKTFSTKLEANDFSGFNRGDNVDVDIIVNMFDNYNTFSVKSIVLKK